MTDTLPLEIALISSLPLPREVLPELDDILQALEESDFQTIFTSPFVRNILEQQTQSPNLASEWSNNISSSIEAELKTCTLTKAFQLLILGIASLGAFLQANTTGPPLNFTDSILLPKELSNDKVVLKQIYQEAVRQLSLDGEDVYHLVPYPLLFTLAKICLNQNTLTEHLKTAPWWRVRVNFLYQRILSDPTSTLHNSIYIDLELLEPTVMKNEAVDKWTKARYLIERAMINNFHNYDAKARKGLEDAAQTTGLLYAMTGRLGKRTKFQIDDITQLVLLAKSRTEWTETGPKSAATSGEKPNTLQLNDDTLLETIAFTPITTTVVDESALPKELVDLSIEDPPVLHPLDATILLLLTETIKNTSPADGITREQMLPYAERVLKHSTNWSVHTIGLLVRSRLEGYKTRTIERGVLQLQVVVDQVIAETTRLDEFGAIAAPSFLPQPKKEESAPVKERLRYVYQLPIPTRWEIESELAGRWVGLGGLRTALEIYERLEMWAEVALCWGAVDREDKAGKVIRALLYEGPMPKAEFETVDEIVADEDEDAEVIPTDDEEVELKERDPPPPNAPRLWCILGDMEKKPEYYERSWIVSGNRFSRAQRSLGRLYIQQKAYADAVEAYALSLKINPLNASSWFSYGCALLELKEFDAAVEAFSRVVSIDDSDAEGWSNLATAILRREPQADTILPNLPASSALADEEETIPNGNTNGGIDKDKNKRDALVALKRAVRLKHDSWRIWENLLIIAASIHPPAAMDVCISIRRIIELRSKQVGESCIDYEILDMLIRHVISLDTENQGYDPAAPGLAKMVVELVDQAVVPLITSNGGLWRTIARLAIWRKHPSTALEAHEKAHRIATASFDIRDDRASWGELVDATVEVVDAYESLGPMERTEGLGSGEGMLVMKEWKFKGRTCVRGVMGKGRKSGWDTEDGEGWERLQGCLEGLK